MGRRDGVILEWDGKDVKALPTIELLYTCNDCGLSDVKVAVTARVAEDVTVWMEETVVPSVTWDHFKRSPYCMAKKLSQLKIPITGASKVGGPVEN